MCPELAMAGDTRAAQMKQVDSALCPPCTTVGCNNQAQQNRKEGEQQARPVKQESKADQAANALQEGSFSLLDSVYSIHHLFPTADDRRIPGTFEPRSSRAIWL
ncbi:hypothetical protein CLAIMM_11732 [Cladophialophora immunda]|nr:hypothetical protein CLAIMM_11732 [Cladophialophora immunda]